MVSCKQPAVQSSKERGNGNKVNEKQHRSLLITMSLKGLVRHVRFLALVYNNLSLQRCCILLHQGENESRYVHASLKRASGFICKIQISLQKVSKRKWLSRNSESNLRRRPNSPATEGDGIIMSSTCRSFEAN